jgi:hypothetical protein
MPAAEQNRYTVSAGTRRATGMSCRVTSAATEKACMPVDVMESVAKKRKNRIMGLREQERSPLR